MGDKIERLLDKAGWEILQALQENARVSWSALGRRVGLSAPAVAERVRRMEDAGLVTGYRAAVDLEKLGFPVSAIIRVSAPEEKCPPLKALIKGLPEVLACHHVTGSDAYVLTVAATSVKHLESLIERLGRYGTPTTSVILSSPVTARPIEARAAAARRPR
jgi:Lrp/AsnC family transcriptional regulator, leucine-responsive regulatory protein